MWTLGLKGLNSIRDACQPNKITKHLSYKNSKGALNNNNHNIYSTSKYKIIYKKFSHPQV